MNYYNEFSLADYIGTKVEIIRAKRLLAVKRNQMKMVWPDLLTEEDKIVFSDDEDDDYFDNNYFRRELIKEILSIKNDEKTKQFWL